MKHYYLQNRNNDYDIFNAFDEFFKPAFFDRSQDLRTNVKETENGYELDVEMPGYTKEQIKVSLENGYLTVGAEKKEVEEQGKKRYLRKEIAESCQRSFYVGKDLSEADVKAKYENGILSLTLPKSQPKQVESHFISVE